MIRIFMPCPSAFSVTGLTVSIRYWLLQSALGTLRDGPRRFTDLRTTIGGVTPKVLTQTLRAMARDGLLTRRAFAEVPPRVEYELTPLGRSLP
jgi:DNA-binding HxlR family transcriptional regulator